MTVPDWVNQLPPERQQQLIAEQQFMLQQMFAEQARQAQLSRLMQKYENPYMSPYMNLHSLQPLKPRDLYIMGQVIDGITGELKHER